MTLEPGTRVRCVDDGGWHLTIGAEYTVTHFEGEGSRRLDRVKVAGVAHWIYASRFKPIVRVKAKCVPTIDLKIKAALAWFDALSPEQQAAHMEVQRRSWVRGEMTLSAMGLG